MDRLYGLKYGAVWLLWCMGVLCGCGNLYTGDETPYNPNNPGGGSGGNGPGGSASENKLPVMVAFSDPIYNILTRGAGVINPDEKEYFHERMGQGTFFIYAFNRINPDGMTYETQRVNDPFSKYCLIDGSCDPLPADGSITNLEESHKHGKRARYAGNGAFANWTTTDNPPYYSTDNALTPYQFFAYYYDDAEIGNVTRDKSGISFPVTVDGSQDLMCSAATNLNTLIADITSGNEIDPGLKELAGRLEKIDVTDLKTIAANYYSTYTARYNIWPVIRMQHQLACVHLKFYPAFIRPQDRIYISKVYIESVNQGTFTVAAYDVSRLGASFPEEGERALLPTYESDAESKNWQLKAWTDPEHPEIPGERVMLTQEDLELPVYQRPFVEGGYVLVPPTNSARLIVETIYYRTPDPNDTGDIDNGTEHYNYRLEIDLHDVVPNYDSQNIFLQYGLMKGRLYTISASVYGPQNIQIQVEPTSWEEGGDIDIDTDEDITNEP